MRIRTTIATGLVAGALLVSGGAFAQSHQGGYLGINPGAHPASTGVAAPTPGSGQGGYLGVDPGARLTASRTAQPEQGSGQGGYLGLTPRVD